jgi:hypothetical protein
MDVLTASHPSSTTSVRSATTVPIARTIHSPYSPHSLAVSLHLDG